jgi:hypothetical protein
MLKYKIARQGQIIGEYDAGSIQLLINSGNLMASDHAWSRGMEGWKRLSELGFASVVVAPSSLPRSDPAPFVQPTNAVEPPLLPAELTTDDWRSMPEGPIPATCPKCASPDIRSFNILYQQGAHTSTSVGITLSGQVGGMVTSGQTHLAAATQPPVRGSDGAAAIALFGMLIGLVLFFTMGMGFLGGFLGVVISIGAIYLGILSSNSADLEHAKQVYRWKNSWCCMKCGHRFMSLHPKANRG